MRNIKMTAVLAAFVMASGVAMADGMLFEPVDVNYAPVNNTPVATSADTATVITDSEGSLIQGASTEKFQNAILELDSVQVELRNTYLAYKEKYQQVDAQYQQIKAERKATSKTVKALEKKIKQIESTKAKIRKTMQ